MPTYLYQVIADGDDGEILEIVHGPHESVLTHPKTGQALKRIYTPPMIAHRYTAGRTKSLLQNDNLARLGFAKYERDQLTGRYHQTAGREKDEGIGD
jgi:predicted nucleic acid-binding Zn ribbon protein